MSHVSEIDSRGEADGPFVPEIGEYIHLRADEKDGEWALTRRKSAAITPMPRPHTTASVCRAFCSECTEMKHG